MGYVIGIDPGANGGISVLDTDGRVIESVRMPPTPEDVLEFLSRYADDGAVCFLEDVGYGLPGQSSKATATFARHNGHLEMALLALRIRTNKATPQKWMKFYQLGRSTGYSKTEWKNKLKAKAQQLFPSEKVTLATCDSLLIAEYGRKN